MIRIASVGKKKEAKIRTHTSVALKTQEANTSRVDQGTAKAKFQHPIIARLLSGARKTQDMKKYKAGERVSSENVIQRVLAAASRGSHQPRGVACEGVLETRKEAVQAGSSHKLGKDDSARTQKTASPSPHNVEADTQLTARNVDAEQRTKAPASSKGLKKSSKTHLGNGAAGVREPERLIELANQKDIPATPSVEGDHAGADILEAARAKRADYWGGSQAGMEGAYYNRCLSCCSYRRIPSAGQCIQTGIS